MGDAADAATGWSWGPISLSLEADLVSPLAPHPSSLTTTARVSIYLPELQLMSESTTTAAPAPAWDYVWFGGQPLAQIEVATGAVRTYFNDHLGTPILQTGEAGTVIWRIEHEPYGEDYAFRAGAELHQPLRFPGQEREVAGELAYNVFRWYRGGWGRYSQADPIGFNGGINWFAYLNGNPVNDIDPFGLAGEKFQVCCRPVQGFQRPHGRKPVALHCYVRMFRGDGSAAARSWGLLNISGQATPGINQLADLHWQEPKWCGPAVGCGDDKITCLDELTKSYPQRTYPSMGLGGPNSNTFARKLADQCDIPAPPEAQSAPGWNWR
jgi:RHS repeat-associated protein